jgi:uncharacterized protein (DUF924 family)
MNNEAKDPVEEILQFWFGTLDEEGRADSQHTTSWFKKDPNFDEEILRRFRGRYEEFSQGTLPSWANGPRGLLSAILVLDQFSRNMFRNNAKMYAFDHLARSQSFEYIALGFDEDAPTAHRIFSYMPLMHSERLVDQDRCVTLFSRFAEEQSGELEKSIRGNLKFAVAHRDIVARFGRFPHRNAILGRASTEEEVAFLSEPGSSF